MERKKETFTPTNVSSYFFEKKKSLEFWILKKVSQTFLKNLFDTNSFFYLVPHQKSVQIQNCKKGDGQESEKARTSWSQSH